MSDETETKEKECHCEEKHHHHGQHHHGQHHLGHHHLGHHHGAADAVYGLGFIGACIYFIGNATTFWMGVLGFLKSIVWPVFLVLEALKTLGVQ